MPYKILIYEDNINLRSSLVSLLQWTNEFEVVAAMPEASEVEKDINLFKPDVIIMDIDMPNSNGVDAVKNIRAVNETLPIIMFTIFDDNDNIFNAMCAGANGYLLKNNFDLLQDALLDVINGGAPMTSSVAKKVLSFLPKKIIDKNNELENLSTREIQILEYVVKGFSYKMISAELDIATETVRTHIKRIYKKLQVNNATGAVYKYNSIKK
jgi:DNA-binding NarL/FixJ family response regulator